ncbi:SAM-dependent methyltransferase [Polymorphobacter fuscus]|uniref:Methyltransferase domain-containing protein n=1 Tax=Sandarakinorhabdus fusca TaxID=1439888 RepID=A0A7C9KZK2_9SPHN|nr:cyclopropane-fatty-acyl-phospholipid synthase family protein [Polymorphobacter fuscus]KAB7644834.1 class I SAM-dependent methyltransferase [Polymorphobacter fuscus]MQT18108.1 methyltransferase domain-containing protein [Polymorphobacter fuscus]NJC09426.1 cyclopropane-fatty-acyl-phospholipid synthase [Polymorphobacter fuscus]
MFLLDRLFKKMIRDGELTVIDAAGTRHVYGVPNPGKPAVTVRFTDTGVANRIALNPALGAGEGYMDGRLVIEQGDIRQLVDLVTWNLRWQRDNPVRFALWRQASIAAKIDQINFARRSKRNVAHHYDLDDRLYDLFLDPHRQYSCAYFDTPDMGLDEAQEAKLAHIAAKLDLKPGQRVLDIGCGWGGLARYLHKVSGAEVLGVTLSEEQLKYARAEAQRQGMGDKVRFELIDYRSLTGQFDRIVSVGMFEHVGLPHFNQFFQTVEALLKTDGVALIHTIARADGPGATDPWTAKYIFPGGYSPALSQIVPAVEKAWLWITDIEVLRLHYGHTIRHWYDRCEARKAEIVAIYDERFYRMWMFYLAAAMSAFFNDGHMNVQIQLTKRRDTLPLRRDYIAAAEAAMPR